VRPAVAWWRIALALCMAALLFAPRAQAHEISMAEIELRQTGPGNFTWQWTAGHRAGDLLLRPQWPDHCTEADGLLRCGEDGLRGTLGVKGLGKRFSAVLMRVHWQDGPSRLYTLTAAQPTVQVHGTSDDARGSGEIARAYGVLGFEHILSGYDHLLFVATLLFLVGFNRRLVWTITAFTLAHSLTLGLSALGWLTLRGPPVEATIALSILLVAGEALRQRDTVTRRWPALVALLFGLVHGLGFAGALQEIGFPEQHLAVALLTFNLGVEAGQLMTVLAVWLVWQALRRSWFAARMRVPALYAIGSVAAYWTLGRVLALFG
jgi:hydrogenase/urease accessory protein HupE